MQSYNKYVTICSMSELKNYRKLLVDADFQKSITAKNVCLFLGAGVARNLKMPDWNGLASNITDWCFKNKIIQHSEVHTLSNMSNPLKEISYCTRQIESKNKENDFNIYLKKIFIENPKAAYEQDSKLYDNFIKLYNSGKVLLVQTNYDRTIENYVDAQPFIPYTEDNNITLTNNLLVYLHGRFDGNYKDIVLTKEKYNEVYVLENKSSLEKQRNFIRQLLKSYTIIMLGYSLQDNEIVQLIANRKNVENYKKVIVIIDTCKAKAISNKIDAQYWKSCCNDNIELYAYSTECYGFKKFNKVVKDLTDKIIHTTGSEPIIEYTNPTTIEGLYDDN